MKLEEPSLSEKKGAIAVTGEVPHFSSLGANFNLWYQYAPFRYEGVPFETLRPQWFCTFYSEIVVNAMLMPNENETFSG